MTNAVAIQRDSSAAVKYKAQEAYRSGEGQDNNPYPKGSIEAYEWAMEMHRLQARELEEYL